MKLIEIIDYLQSINKIPKNDIMVLFPDAGIEKQFKNEVKKYNYFKQKQIKINSLKDYDDVKAYPTLLEEINIFSYRSDLLSEEEKDKKININAYDNNGKWFVFMDEAHKGDKSGKSKRQNYITQWTRIIGYLRPIRCFDKYRQIEAKTRVYSNGKSEIKC